MCDCQNRMIEKFKEMYPEATSIVGQYEILSGRAYSTVKVKLPNQKKEKEVLLLHSHCPTCGEKYPSTEQ